MGYLFLLLALGLNATASILLKLSSSGRKNKVSLSTLLSSHYLWLALLSFSLNFVFYTLALSKINLSIAYPVMAGGGFFVITLFSIFHLKEPIHKRQLFGIFVLTLGIILITYQL